MAASCMRSLLPFQTMPARAAWYAAYSVISLACWIIVSWMIPSAMKTISGMISAASTATWPDSRPDSPESMPSSLSGVGNGGRIGQLDRLRRLPFPTSAETGIEPVTTWAGADAGAVLSVSAEQPCWRPWSQGRALARRPRKTRCSGACEPTWAAPERGLSSITRLAGLHGGLLPRPLANSASQSRLSRPSRTLPEAPASRAWAQVLGLEDPIARAQGRVGQLGQLGDRGLRGPALVVCARGSRRGGSVPPMDADSGPGHGGRGGRRSLRRRRRRHRGRCCSLLAWEDFAPY